jgi:hypothetical protein|tara:strand:- start:68 stop:931 length:864 start_codon:yes stop_codon:yes gene_type:complete
VKTVIISAADSGFFQLLSGLVKSIRARRPEPIPHCVLDCGLEPDQRTWLAGQEVSLVTPDWDYSGFEVPGVWFKAMTARPHLPRWVPGYEMYLWIDADAWIQDWSAVAKFIAGASEAGVAAVKEADHAYPETIGPTPDRHGPLSTDWHGAVVKSFFGPEVAAKIGRLPLINSGVFAARAESGLWPAWSDALKTALSTARDNLFLSEQTAFNVALLEYGVPFANQPAWCNWACNRAWPLINSAGQLVEPVFPHRPLGIVHMTGETKKGSHPIPVQGGGTSLRTLEYPG